MPTIDYATMSEAELQEELQGLLEELETARLHLAGAEEDVRNVQAELKRRKKKNPLSIHSQGV